MAQYQILYFLYFIFSLANRTLRIVISILVDKNKLPGGLYQNVDIWS